MALNDTHLRTAKRAKRGGQKVSRKLTDGRGLYLEVRPSGAKLWRYRYRVDGKENVFAMGQYFADPKTPGHISLDDARNARARCRELVKQGNALDDAAISGKDQIAPGRFASSLERIEKASGVFFHGRERTELQGFTNLMRHAERFGQFTENPPTGNRAVGVLLGGGWRLARW